MAVGGPVQHDPCQVAFHSPAGRLPARLIPARRRRPAPCARRQQTMVLPSPSRGLVRHAPTVASQAPSDPSTAAPTHARWFSAPETIARCLSVDQVLLRYRVEATTFNGTSWREVGLFPAAIGAEAPLVARLTPQSAVIAASGERGQAQVSFTSDGGAHWTSVHE